MSDASGVLINAYIDKLSNELLDAVRGRALGQARADVAEVRAARAESERDGLLNQVRELRSSLEKSEAEVEALKRRCASMAIAVKTGPEELACENSAMAARMSNMLVELEELRERVSAKQEAAFGVEESVF